MQRERHSERDGDGDGRAARSGLGWAFTDPTDGTRHLPCVRQRSTSDLSQTLNDLLSEHSLESTRTGNELGVLKSVDATQIGNRTLNDAVH
jgi:hypothetical protein